MKELDLQIVTKQVGGLLVDDMIKMFGWRIKRAVYYTEDGKPDGLISVKMVKLMRWWKFWNNDIKKAYKRYTGMILVPWTVETREPETMYGEDIDWEALRTKEVDPRFYSQLKTEKDDDSVDN